jgi:hypothetical protein
MFSANPYQVEGEGAGAERLLKKPEDVFALPRRESHHWEDNRKLNRSLGSCEVFSLQLSELVEAALSVNKPNWFGF